MDRAAAALLPSPAHPERSRGGDAALDASASPAAKSRGAEDASSSPPILSARGVHHTYEGRTTPALDGIDLSIQPGEFLAILGANGSGKSTLARVLNGLLKPDSGTLHGADPRAVGFVFQNPDHQIFCASAEEEVSFGPRNMGLSRDEVRARAAAALEVVGLAGAERRDPFGMSKSDRQRLAVASVLAMETPVIVMDEPTTGLDQRDQRRMMDLLARLHARGHTVIAITHHIWIALEYARRIILMAHGKILADGPAREVISRAADLERARVRLPPLVRLGLRLGVPALGLEELARCLVSPAAPAATEAHHAP